MRELIKTDGTRQPFDKPQSIKQIEKLINADCLYTFSLGRQPNSDVVMVNGDGHALGLPVNVVATQMYQSRCHPGTTHQIRGDVFVCSDDDFAL